MLNYSVAELRILKKCLQSFSQQLCPFFLLFNHILTLQKTLPSVPSVFVSYFFDFPHFPKNQVFSIRYYFISRRYSFISQRYFIISQRYFIISQRYFIISQRYFIISQRYFPCLIASLEHPLRKNKEIPGKACGFKNKVVTLRKSSFKRQIRNYGRDKR